jgi:hypothetical protein
MSLPYPIDDGGGPGGGIGGGGTPTPTPSPTPTPTPGAPPPPAPAPGPPTPPPPGASSIIASSVDGVVSVFLDVIPLGSLPTQTQSTQLGNQSCTINVFTKTTGLYLDLYVSDAPVVLGALCLNNDFIVRDDYLGFAGDLFFVDMQGDSDPTYDGLGDRYQLFWIHQ